MGVNWGIDTDWIVDIAKGYGFGLCKRKINIPLTAVPPSADLRGGAAKAAARSSLAIRRDRAPLTLRSASLEEPTTIRIVSAQRAAADARAVAGRGASPE